MKNQWNTISKNKKAYFDYEILDFYEAWIELKWYEVKSIRAWNINLKWSYVSLVNWEAYIRWAHVWLIQNNILKKIWEATRDRKIFIHRKTINYLSWKIKEAWNTVIPLEVYTSWNLIKLKIWLCKWRKKYDKKQVLKERSIDKEAKVMMKKFYG